MNIGSLVSQLRGKGGHYYSNAVIGGNSSAVLGDVHIHGRVGTDSIDRDGRERQGRLWFLSSQVKNLVR